MLLIPYSLLFFSFFFFNDTATTEIYTLSLHDALPISPSRFVRRPRSARGLPARAARLLADAARAAGACPTAGVGETRRPLRLGARRGGSPPARGPARARGGPRGTPRPPRPRPRDEPPG